jgi:uncharacterized membrane protein
MVMAAEDARLRSRKALGVIFLGVSVLHFAKRDFFAKLVPPQLQDYEQEVDLGTEALMAASGICFLVPRLRRVARFLTLGFLIPTLPVAVNQMREPEQTDAAGIPQRVVTARIPAQIAMCTWIWWATK